MYTPPLVLRRRRRGLRALANQGVYIYRYIDIQVFIYVTRFNDMYSYTYICILRISAKSE